MLSFLSFLCTFTFNTSNFFLRFRFFYCNRVVRFCSLFCTFTFNLTNFLIRYRFILGNRVVRFCSFLCSFTLRATNFLHRFRFFLCNRVVRFCIKFILHSLFLSSCTNYAISYLPSSSAIRCILLATIIGINSSMFSGSLIWDILVSDI